MAIKKERRSRARVPLSGLAVVTFGKNMQIASALNIAAGGISVVVPQKVSKDSEVSVEFGLPGVEGRFLIKAVVARTVQNPDGFQLGLRFKDEGWVLARVQEFVRDRLVKIVREKKKKAPVEKDRAKASAPKPFRREKPPDKPPEKQEDYRATKMTIDLDSSERASEVARLFKEAMKKKD
jgi:hypothetical protein